MGILYLIQPAEYIGTDCYKIGYSSNSNIDRVKYGYKKGTRYFHIVECDNANKIEKILIEVFNENFTLFAGREYFKGDINEMLDLFYNVYKNNKNIETTNKIQETVYQEKCDKQYDCDDEEECEEECEEVCDEVCDDECHEECEELTDKDNESIKEVKTKKNTNYKYTCEKCNFKTNDKKDYRRHLLTLKHKKITEEKEKKEKPKISKIKCNCGKEYTYKSGYYRHKKTCNYKEEVKEKKQSKNVILELLNQNKELKELLIKQQEDYKNEMRNLVLTISSKT